MAKWGRGESDNPSGRPKLPEEVREMRRLTVEQITLLFSKYLGMTMSEMSAVKKEELSLLELWIIKAAETGMRAGNYLMLDKMLDRVIGKTVRGLISKAFMKAIQKYIGSGYNLSKLSWVNGLNFESIGKSPLQKAV